MLISFSPSSDPIPESLPTSSPLNPLRFSWPLSTEPSQVRIIVQALAHLGHRPAATSSPYYSGVLSRCPKIGLAFPAAISHFRLLGNANSLRMGNIYVDTAGKCFLVPETFTEALSPNEPQL